MTTTLVVEREAVTIPGWVDDLESFRRWARSEEFPETGRICYLEGEVWVDISKEQFFSHNQVKNEFNITLGGLIKTIRVGRYIPDGMLLTNEDADLAAQPDAAFVSYETTRLGRIRLVEGVEEGYVELEGMPDMVLEIVSTSSVEKDHKRLRELYWRAGIREYWIVDARDERLTFDILRHTANGYVTTRKQGGWMKSAVFGKSFRRMRKTDEEGSPEFALEIR
jgi:Uma2 family endonuclease